MIRYETQGRCAILTLDRPEARNALTPEMVVGLEGCLDRAEADDDVWVTVLAGAPPAFCAGSDLTVVQAGRAELLWTDRGGYGGLVRRTRSKPLIAAVDGPAVAGGAELVLACDLVVASRAASFGLPEVRIGLIPGAGGLHRLGRKVPINVAMEVALTGEPIDASAAHRHGLVNALCEPGQAVQEALALASRITTSAPLAVREARTLVVEATAADDDTAWTQTEAAIDRVVATEDAREGVAAFLGHRAPSWRGR